MEDNIKLKSVSELLDLKFVIPSYQRGYRWTRMQVDDLLNDIDQFEPQGAEGSDEEGWYCLQPLVVKRQEEGEYEVIDGQQRLTTIFIILNMLEDRKLSLCYKTRPLSEEFLQKIETEDRKNADNIDFYFMLEAKETVEEWRKGKNVDAFLQKLKNHCKVIWYETQDGNAYEVFKRLNSGKISLSNAELVKALLLKDDNFRDKDREVAALRQLEMAAEWDRMEQTLQEDAFWYFINPRPDYEFYRATRMDFVLDMLLRCELREKGREGNEVDKELQRNNYFIFHRFSEMMQSENGWKDCWGKIQRLFRLFKWGYDDRRLYHYIGYLMNLKGKDKVKTLEDLVLKAGKTKPEFLNYIKGCCIDSLPMKLEGATYRSSWEDLEYGKDNDAIHNILLLFNLATVQNQVSEQARYPFDRHVKEKWSLEHIHAQNERRANWNKDEVKQIKEYLSMIQGENVKELSGSITEETLKDRDTYDAVIGAFMGAKVEESKGKFSSTFIKDDHLTNMALLQRDKNSAFNNKLYPEKRCLLASYEKSGEETEFVPICTRNAFFKHYSPDSMNPFVWDEEAGKDYVRAMEKTVVNYLRPLFEDKDVWCVGVESLSEFGKESLSDKESDTNANGDFKYGLIIYGDKR